MEREKKIILFGAGQFGKKALQYFSAENVQCFVDNNQNLVGHQVEGRPVISFGELKKIHKDYQIVLSVDVGTSFVLAAQLEEVGIYDYKRFLELVGPNTARRTSSAIHPESRNWKGKRLLMVAYQFPPLSGSGVFRSLKFAKYLPEFGWKPTVISTDCPRPGWNYLDESLVEEIPDDVDVIRIPDRINSFLEKSLSDCEDTLLPFLREFFQGDKKACSLISSLENTRTGRAELMTFPCTCLAWAYDVVQYIEKNIDISQYQAIYTSSDPYSAHLVGAFFKKKYGLSWISDYRDPWTGSPVFKMDNENSRDQLLFCLESNLLQKADRNVVVGEELIQDYIDRFPVQKDRFTSITNGYDEEDFEGLPVVTEQPEKFTINYSGLLHDGRNISPLLDALRQLGDEGRIDISCIRFRVVGDAREYNPCKMAGEYGLDSILEQTGYLSHQDVLASNLEANMLLLLLGDSNKLKATCTGKIFEYLRSGRPILALVPLGGVVDEILRKTGHGEAHLSTDISGIKAMILREYQKWQRGEKRKLLHSPLIEQFERKRLTEQLAVIFDQISC